MNLSRIPTEILLIIFSYLNGQDLIRLASSCKSLSLISLQALYTTINVNDILKKRRNMERNILLKVVDFLELCLFKANNSQNRLIRHLLNSLDSNGKFVKNFIFWGDINDRHLMEITSKCYFLKSLDISNTKISDASLCNLASISQTLKALNIANCEDITDFGMSKLLSELTDLKCLNLHSCSNITNKTITAIAKYQQNIRKLILSENLSINDVAVIELLRKCRYISYLNINSCPHLSNQTIQSIGLYCSQLEWLDISQRVWKTLHPISDHSVTFLLRNCHKLELLDISYCKSLSDTIIENISKYCRLLKSLSINGLDRITRTSITHLVNLRNKYKNLQWLQIANCVHIDSNVMKEMYSILQGAESGCPKGENHKSLHTKIMGGKTWETSSII
jgi:hypothetical protein